MSGNVSKDGIKKDLQAMKDAGLGGVHLFYVEPVGTARGSLTFGSQDWNECLDYAVKTAGELGLDFTMHNCGGFATSAGPWITPDKAMRQLVYTQTNITSSDKNIKLKRFKTSENKFPLIATVNPCQPEQLKDKEKLMDENYEDVAVIAFPTPQDDLNGEGFRIDNWRIKAFFGDGSRNGALFPKEDLRKAPHPINLDEIINLTDKMDKDGNLAWQAPDGNWTILRFGSTITGMQNHPAFFGSRGLECDKLDASAVEFHFNKAVKPLLEKYNTPEKKLISSILVDSYEALEQNWTKKLPQEFFSRKGYDLLKHLPILTGRAVNSTQYSELFLRDFRRTICDMAADYHYATFAKLCHENGVQFVLEGYGWPSMIDMMNVTGLADFPMGEFWIYRMPQSITGTIKMSASSALFGKKKWVGAEAFTAGRAHKSFEDSPADFKIQGDFYMTRGLNKIVLQGFTHQPWADDIKPGMSMWLWGSQINRNNTWWKALKNYSEYLTRTQYMLQEGRAFMDIAVCYGSNTPSGTGLVKKEYSNVFNPDADLQLNFAPKIPEGFDYAILNEKILYELDVDDEGYLTHPSGAKFRLLTMQQDKYASKKTLEKIRYLLGKGAHIMMDKPLFLDTLQGAEKHSDSFLKEIDEVWLKYKSKGDAGLYSWQDGVENALGKDFAPDFTYEAQTDVLLKFAHRIVDGKDIYFVVNFSNKKIVANLKFRVTGKTPKIFLTENGEVFEAPLWSCNSQNQTEVFAEFAKDESKFFVFENTPASIHATESNANANLSRLDGKLVFVGDKNALYTAKLSDGKNISVNIDGVLAPMDISADWEFSFPDEMRKDIKMPTLESWGKFEDFDEKHFAGCGVYKKYATIPESMFKTGQGAVLDLGKVAINADIYINSKYVTKLWKAPYVVDISKYLVAGKNLFEIKVTNTWTNRLIGDEYFDDIYADKESKAYEWLYQEKSMRPKTQRKTFTSYSFIKNKNTPLVDAGLLGPVSIRFYKTFFAE